MLLNDLRFALRTLFKSPGYLLTAAATIALGVASTAAVFSVTDAVLINPLPYKDPSRLVIISSDLEKRNVRDFPLADADFLDLRRATAKSTPEIGGVVTFTRTYPLEDGSAEQVHAAAITTNFLSVLGGRIIAGRDFVESDGLAPPANPAQANQQTPSAILSYEYWQRRFGGKPGIVGKRMLNGGTAGPLIVGVLQPHFELYFPPSANLDKTADIWLAALPVYDNSKRNEVQWQAVGRLAPGATIEQTQAAADQMAVELGKSYTIKNTAGLHFRVEPIHNHLVAGVRVAILTLMGAVLFLLLIAGANVANLVLVRASLRIREYAVRTALGSGVWNLVRQAWIEALLLTAIGTVAGLALASVGLDRLLLLAPVNLPRLESASINPAVVAFVAVAALIASTIFGMAPILRVTRMDTMSILRTDGRNPSLGGGSALRSVIVVAEVALCFVLLIGSGLLLRSFLELQKIDPGFDPNGLFTFNIAGLRGDKPEDRAAVQRQLQERLAALPGVQSAAATFPLPLGGGFSPIRWGTEEALSDPSKFKAADFQIVLPGYFETLRTRLLDGRSFTNQDNSPTRKVVIVDQMLAARAFGASSAVGKRILLRIQTPEPEWYDIIGVAAHQRDVSLADPGREQVYFTDGLLGHGAVNSWALRTTVSPAELVPRIRQVVAQIDARAVITDAQPMSLLVERAQSATRFQLLLIAIFAGIAALLSAVGLYGVLSTSVSQRTAEIGVRMALGAAPAHVFRLIVGQGLLLSAIGAGLGTLAALILTRFATSLLVGVKPADPLTYIAVACGFFLIAAAASWLPARRAAGFDPMEALRDA